MALKGYFGSPGSGKSYEVVENVIVPALAAGRRVVTNLAGLNFEAIEDYIEANKLQTGVSIGEIKKIALDQSLAGKIAVIHGDGENAVLDESASVISGGDLVVFDEVWRIWEDGQKIDPMDLIFLRLHRHLLHPVTHISTDIVLIAQNYVDVNRKVRSLIEERYEMKKHLALGLSSRYRVDIFSRGARKPHVSLQRRYKKEVFALYKSHSLGSSSGKEINVDTRGNIFKSSMFSIFVPLAIFVLMVGGWFLWRFFHPSVAPSKTKEAEKETKKELENSTQRSSVKLTEISDNDKVHSWRVIGHFSDGQKTVVLIDLGNGSSAMQRVVDDSFVVNGFYSHGQLDGKHFGSFSGVQQNSSLSIK